MKKIFVVTEGQSETNFVKRVVAPYFADKCILIPNTVVTKVDHRKGKTYKGGVGNYEQIRSTLSKTLANLSKDKDSYVTTMFDFYRLPLDVPGVLEAKKVVDLYEKVALIEREIREKEKVDEKFFFPYIALHEFEAMLFSDITKLEEVYFENDLTALKKCIEIQGNPELINDGSETSPSKRIIHCIKSYDKANVGVDVLGRIGVEGIAEKCSHFSAWLRQINERIL